MTIYFINCLSLIWEYTESHDPPPRKKQLGRSVFEHLRRACGLSCQVEGERLTYECDLTRSEGCLKGFLLLCFVDSHGNAHSAHMQGTAWQQHDVATLRFGDWFPCPLTLFPFGNTNSVPLEGTVAPETGVRQASEPHVCLGCVLRSCCRPKPLPFSFKRGMLFPKKLIELHFNLMY